MKVQSNFSLVVVVMFLAVVLTVSGASAQEASKVPVVITEYIVDSQIGDETTPGDNYHARGMSHETIELSENACVNGPGFIEYKINVNKNGHVYAGGTWVIESETYEGTWEMNWHVTTNKPIVAVGQGTGVFQGMSIKLTLSGGGVDENGEYLIFAGEILVPPHAQVQCAD